MLEVTVKLRFQHHCLGDVRAKRKNLNKFLYTPDGKHVMFLRSWWQSIIRFAAGVINQHQDVIDDIEWDLKVDGKPRVFRRYYQESRYTLHEAFLAGDEIYVQAVLPAKLSEADFQKLLSVAGKYRGISPYKAKDGYGRFEVLSVRRTKSARQEDPQAVREQDSQAENKA